MARERPEAQPGGLHPRLLAPPTLQLWGKHGSTPEVKLLWEAWYRHVTLSLLAHAYLAVLRSEAHDAAQEPEAKRGIVVTSS